MTLDTQTVILRHLVPSEGKVIKNTVTEDYFPEGLYLGKNENAENFIEVDASDLPSEDEEQ